MLANLTNIHVDQFKILSGDKSVCDMKPELLVDHTTTSDEKPLMSYHVGLGAHVSVCKNNGYSVNRASAVLIHKQAGIL